MRIFFTGMSISFLGTLPLGTLNVSAMQIAVSDGIPPAMLFATGALLVEMAYVRLSLSAIEWVRRHERLFRLLEWATLAIIVALAVASFLAAFGPDQRKNAILSGKMPRFLLGMLMSAVNPAQVPFWFGWSTVLLSRGSLVPNNRQYNAYIMGIGMGSFIGFCLFILGGKWAVSKMEDSRSAVHLFVGVVFSVTAIIQLWRMMKKRGMPPV